MQPRRRERIDESDPIADWYGRLVLEPVAWPDLTQIDTRGPGAHIARLRGSGDQSARRRTRSLIGVGPRLNDSRIFRSM